MCAPASVNRSFLASVRCRLPSGDPLPWGSHGLPRGSHRVQPEGQIKTMLELKVNLDFECSHCSHSVGVTLACKGKGLAEGPGTVAAVNVPCPTCGTIN